MQSLLQEMLNISYLLKPLGEFLQSEVQVYSQENKAGFLLKKLLPSVANVFIMILIWYQNPFNASDQLPLLWHTHNICLTSVPWLALSLSFTCSSVLSQALHLLKTVFTCPQNCSVPGKCFKCSVQQIVRAQELTVSLVLLCGGRNEYCYYQNRCELANK